MRKLSVTIEKWPLKQPFVISRMAPMLHGEVVVVEIEQDGIIGRGECERSDVFEPGYPSVTQAIEKARKAIEHGATRHELLTVMPAGCARNAVDCALFDLEAKQQETTGWQLAGLQHPPQPVTTVFTLSLDSPENMAAMAAENKNRPLLKLKLGREGDIERVAAVRTAAPDARLVIDANTGWSLAQLQEYLPELAKLGVEMVEQPLPPEQDHLLELIDPIIPIAADESCIDRRSLPQLKGRYQIVNIKLDKTGGMTEALELMKEAKSQGFDIMVGCMIGTSLAMAPALLLAQQARWVDIDGPLLLAGDRADGLIYQGSTVHPAKSGMWG
ncbi:dipeptide epimerase [Photobacterium sp. SDRW27]|uniref:N-acetyl-D-Glu racemase DgcA n=1 Tax=Photobacterium obscurum TaxID=2829490 RepID=UPI002244228F|nr:N-acetyl-D-Glu racemase DgcA [Photobacterium obscurum]MCW8331417.1 dipeptide epimerase [Photobacterium obscurum]